MYKINIFFLFIFTSCGLLTTAPPPPTEKTYSEETNRAFSMIENNGSYRAKINHTQIEKQNHVPQVTQTQNKSNSKSLIEVNQYLAFYCMQHRKSKRFKGNEKNCLAHVNLTLQKCQKNFPESQSKLLKCVKSKIKT